MKRIALVFAILIVATNGSAALQVTTVFKGIPTFKISEGGIERSPESLPRDRAVNLECVISRIGEKHYWASRENKELVAIEAGPFITFVAIDGAGYVRIVKPEMKKAVYLAMSETESKFDYVEHLLIGLRSVTYYGSIR